MSRLERHRKKQFTLNVIFFLGLLVIVVLFISTLGFKLLLNSSVFIANITRPKNDSSQKNSNNPLVGKINVDDIPIATNSAKIIVSGTAVNYKKLDFYLNSEKVKEIQPEKDQFTERIGDLQEGSNELYVSGTSDSNKTQSSAKYTIFYKKDKPMLEIKKPQDKTTVNNNELTIRGQTDKEVFIKVNNLPSVVDTEGNFQTIIRLTTGENKITIVAQDTAGNIEKKELTVTYSKD